MKKFVLLLVFLVAGAGFYATPYYTAHQMQQAAQSNNHQALNSYVDYPALKESLKVSLNNSVGESLLKNKTDSGMNAFAAMFAAAFVNPLVDVLVTPENIAAMLQADMPKDLKKSESNNTQPAPPEDELITRKYYQDFDHFVIDVSSQKRPHEPFKFTFTRQGLLSWKLTGLTIPKLST